MARRRTWWIGLGIVLVVLLAFGTWRLLQEVPGLLAKAEDSIRKEAEAFGVQVSFRNLRFHPLHLRVSAEDLDIRDGIAGTPLVWAEQIEVSVSLRRILWGRSPVSRVLVRSFSVHAGEANRPLLEKFRDGKKREGKEELPEILLIDGEVHVGPLGPLERGEAKVPKVRIRPVRFLGTRITAEMEQVAGRLSLPGEGSGGIPFDSMEADFFLRGDSVRFRKFRATGPSANIVLSGQWNGERRAADVQWSGDLDVARWTDSGAAGGNWVRPVARAGKIAFSGRVEGPLENPEGSGKVLARNLLFLGNTPADAELSLAWSGKKIRLESLRGKLWDGVASGAGIYDFRDGKGSVRLSLERAAFAKAPWSSWDVAWRPSGRGDLVLALSGGLERIEGTVSLKNPSGWERPESAGVPAAKIALPITALAAGDLVPGKAVRIRDLRVTAGGAEAAGTGSYALAGRILSFSGKFSVPRGKASQYGWVYPLSWKAVSGVWELSGSADNPRLAAGVRAEEIAARELPPVPLSVRLEGALGDMVHFVADIPAEVAKVTAVGTFTGPLSRRPIHLEATVGARDIDFSLAGDWSAAVLSSLGKDPAQLRKQTAGWSGTGTADLRISLTKGAHTLSGTIVSPEVRFPRIIAREVSASGNWVESTSGSRWSFRAQGEFGKGAFRLEGRGEGKDAEISGTMKDIDLETAASLLDRESGPPIGGRVDLRVEAAAGPNGWEIGKFSASIPRLSVAGVTVEEFSAEGSLGPSTGVFTIVSSSPRVKGSADIRRGKDWPVSFSVRAEEVPTEMLLGAIGRGEVAGAGAWDASAEGTLRIADILAGGGLRPETFSGFRFSLSSASPSVSGISFASVLAEGKMEGEAITGEIATRIPETRLTFSLSLRQPFGFRVEGPFAVEKRAVSEAEGIPVAPRGSMEAKGNGRARFSAAGTVQVSGSLRALDNTRGMLRVQRMFYRHGGIDLTGEGISVLLNAEGIQWESGSVKTSGNPLHVSGKASWAGNLDARIDGKVPAAAIRLATDVFDRLDGMIRTELRVTGRWDDPSVIGTGHLEDGTFSFRGYAQLFERMSADAVISREKIIFEHFEGRSGGGYIDGRGELPLRFAGGQKMFFSVDFFDIRYPYPEDLRPMVQGHVELIGPLRDLLISGDLEIQSARYTKTVRPEQALLDFRKRLADVRARRKEGDFRIRLDLEALADDTIQVKNNLAEANIKGEFKVVGDTSRVIILGAFDVTEGRVDYRGNRYELIRGGLEFQDPRNNNPRLDFRAETKKGNVIVTVSVSGTLEKYEVELFSDPPLSKNDIVSLLTLGVTTESFAEGGGGAVSAAQAAAIALGPYKGRVEEGISSVIGLDKFAIEPAYSSTTRSTEPRFIVGKTFGDRFSVSVSTNVGSTTESSAFAEYKVFENVYLQGGWESSTTTREGDLGGDVKFRYRYRQFRDFLLGSE